MIYLTGDTHREFGRVGAFCDKFESTPDDTLIILGDAGINYCGRDQDVQFKRMLADNLPITIFCIHGNHEMRPESCGTYKEAEWHGGMVYREPEFLTLLFAKDGEIYDFGGKKCIAIGGAYSVDKYYRLSRDLGWWADELPSAEIKQRVGQRLDAVNWQVDIVLSHTCPKKYIPTEMFLPGIDQSAVDNSAEEWLDTIDDKLTCGRWYCGHWHTSKTIDRMRFMFKDYLGLT